MNTLTFGGNQRKPRKDPHKLFMERSYRLHADHTRKLNEAAYGKDKEQWPSQRLTLPYSVEFLRVEMNKVVGMKHCRYCGAKLTAKNISLDHAIPVKRRAEADWLEACVPLDCPDWLNWPESRNPKRVDIGLLLAAYSWLNADVECCIKCNKQKGEMTAVDFAKLCECLLTLTPNSAAYVRRQLGMMPSYQFGRSKKQEQKAGYDENF